MSWQVSGFKAWFLQRLTAVYIGLFMVFAGVWFLLFADSIDYQQWTGMFKHPAINVTTLLFFYAIIFHAWIGMRDIVIDYIHLSSLRILSLAMIALGLFVMAIWVSLVLLMVVQF